jgi:hypothetical protein
VNGRAAMNHRDARIGAGLAGGLLFVISIVDVALGTDNPNVVNLVTGILGAALLIGACFFR